MNQKKDFENGSKFIVFEGLDGSGKTTQLKYLKNKIYAGLNPLSTPWFTREPTEGSIGKLAKVNFDIKCPVIAGRLKNNIFVNDRVTHLYGRKGILAHLQAGHNVFCDRYILSNLAYNGNSVEELSRLKNLNAGFKKPDITIFIRTSVEECLARIKSRNNGEVLETKDYLSQIESRYDRLLDSYDNGIVYDLDGMQNQETIHDNILKFLQINKVALPC